MKPVITFFVLVFIFGCASIEKAPSSKDAEAKTFNSSVTKAVLYVYRDNIVNSLVAMDILINGRYVGKMRSGNFMRLELKPGQYSITSRASNDKTIALTALAGKVYFVQQIGVFKFLQHGTDIRLANVEEGKKSVLNSVLVVQVDFSE